jgi:FKBP-type peptidyl-prolyl cis-trans isomerase
MSTTSKKQRIVIWGILILTVFSTIALYAGIVVTQQNTAKETAEATEAQTKLNENLEVQKAKVAAKVAELITPKANELSSQYYSEFSGYKSKVGAFNSASITELKTEDLKSGDGTEITSDFTDYSLYYIGWQPDGTIFDSSIDGESLKAPLAGDGSYITGWSEGVIGMKIGGVRELSIPSDKAYGESGSGTEGEDGYIAPNTPLKFVVMAIPKADITTESAISAEIPYSKGTFDLCIKAYKEYVSQYGEETVKQYICGTYQNEEE